MCLHSVLLNIEWLCAVVRLGSFCLLLLCPLLYVVMCFSFRALFMEPGYPVQSTTCNKTVFTFPSLHQTVGYNIWTRIFLMRNLSLIGSLLLLLAEACQDSRSLLAGLPSVGDESRSRRYLQLGGRLLIVLMFLTLIHWDGSFYYLCQVSRRRLSRFISPQPPPSTVSSQKH